MVWLSPVQLSLNWSQDAALVKPTPSAASYCSKYLFWCKKMFVKGKPTILTWLLCPIYQRWDSWRKARKTVFETTSSIQTDRFKVCFNAAHQSCSACWWLAYLGIHVVGLKHEDSFTLGNNTITLENGKACSLRLNFDPFQLTNSQFLFYWKEVQSDAGAKSFIKFLPKWNGWFLIPLGNLLDGDSIYDYYESWSVLVDRH